MGTLRPNEPLIYERADGVVYARYANDHSIPRWIVGGDPAGVARAQGDMLEYGEWQHLCELAEEHPTLKKLLDQLIITYLLVKDDK